MPFRFLRISIKDDASLHYTREVTDTDVTIVAGLLGFVRVGGVQKEIVARGSLRGFLSSSFTCIISSPVPPKIDV